MALLADAPAQLDRILNLIPAQYILERDSELQSFGAAPATGDKKKKDQQHAKFDPEAFVSTVDAIVSAAQRAGGGKASQGRKQGPKKAKKAAAARSAAVESSAEHQSLKEKLHAKIEKMKEDRRLKQSARDKAAKAAKQVGAEAIAEDIDVSLKFEQDKSKIPFDQWHNAPGTKAKRLRQQIAAAERAEVDQSGNNAHSRSVDTALRRAAGQKVGTDLKQLRKAQKKHNKKKEMAASGWHERAHKMTVEKAEKLEKRKENMSKCRGKKVKGAPAGTLPRAGFEGKSNDFLNKKKKK